MQDLPKKINSISAGTVIGHPDFRATGYTFNEGEETEVIGFENHGGQTFNVNDPFGKVVVGNGNKFEDKEEGFFIKNVIATYLHGPLLSKNPKVADYIIKYCLERKSNFTDKIELQQLNDKLEETCREQLLGKFTK